MKHISDVLRTTLKRRAVLVREQATQVAIIAEEHELDLRAAIDSLDQCATQLEILASGWPVEDIERLRREAT